MQRLFRRTQQTIIATTLTQEENENDWKLISRKEKERNTNIIVDYTVYINKCTEQGIESLPGTTNNAENFVVDNTTTNNQQHQQQHQQQAIQIGTTTHTTHCVKLEVSEDDNNINDNKISDSSSTNANTIATFNNNNRKIPATPHLNSEPPKKKLKTNHNDIRKQKCAIDNTTAGTIKQEKASDNGDNNNKAVTRLSNRLIL